MRRIAAIALSLLLVGTAQAMVADRATLKDPVEEARARAMMRDIRCLVCQNESIAESDAELAHDLRQVIREQIAAGKSDDEIRSYLVERYGDWILMTTPVNGRTIFLWLMPVALVGAGAFGAFLYLRRGQTGSADTPLSPDEAAALKSLEGPDA